MHYKIYTHLESIFFKDLENWSVGHLLGRNLRYTDKYPKVSIGDIIKKSQYPIEIKDDIQYKQITLKTNGGGSVLRDIKWGKDIGTKKQYVVSKGQFIMSKIDARNGAFGIITEDLDGAVVTSDFPLFDVNSTKVLPNYLALIASTKEFARFAQSCSRGTTNRQRIDINLFLSQQIPLPSLLEQKIIVNAYNNKIQQAALLERQAEHVERNIEVYLLTELGTKSNGYTIQEPSFFFASEPQIEYAINQRKNGKTSATYQWESETENDFRYLKFGRFKNIEKWGNDFTIGNFSNTATTVYPTKRISELCTISSGGTPSRGHQEYYNGTIPWIKTGELRNEILYDTEEKITQQGLDNSSAKLFPQGSLVIAMYGATIGKTAKLGISAATNQACAVLFNMNNQLVQTDYLWFYLQYQTDNLKKMAYGGAQPNINAGIISNYIIPLPPLATQMDIIKHISMQKLQIKELEQQARILRKKALEEFEKEIFE